MSSLCSCRLARLSGSSAHSRREDPRGAGSSLRVTPQRRLWSLWLHAEFYHPVPPRRVPSWSAGRDAGFQSSVQPQRRGGSRAAQTFIPVDPGRVIIGTLISISLKSVTFVRRMRHVKTGRESC